MILANSLLVQENLGKGVVFPLTTDKTTRGFKKARYEENVKQCVIWLISTRIGERVMQEDVGTSVHSALFQNVETVAATLPFEIEDALGRFEPRVRDVQVKPERVDATELRVTVTWTVKSTGLRDNYVYPYSTAPEKV